MRRIRLRCLADISSKNIYKQTMTPHRPQNSQRTNKSRSGIQLRGLVPPNVIWPGSRFSIPGQRGWIPGASGVTDHLNTSVMFSMTQKITRTNAPKSPYNGVLHCSRPGRPSYSRDVLSFKFTTLSLLYSVKHENVAETQKWNDFSSEEGHRLQIYIYTYQSL